MSEYQYYEFLAIDRPLDRAARDALRSISSRARITVTSFTNHYEWGDLKGDPREFMERWFDLHLYLANWGTRRLMLRVSKDTLRRVLRRRALPVGADTVRVLGTGDFARKRGQCHGTLRAVRCAQYVRSWVGRDRPSPAHLRRAHPV